MSPFFKRVEREVAYAKMYLEEGKGPVSRILVHIYLLVLVYLLVCLFKSQQYVALGVLLALGFTRFGSWVSMGLLVYFLIANYWLGAALVALQGAIGMLVVWFAERDVKRTLLTGRAKVSPFEGMPLLLPFYKLIFLALALLARGIVALIAWALFGFALLYEAGYFYTRLKYPWCRLHFSLMMRYSLAVGSQMGIAATAGKNFNIEDVLCSIVKGAYPNWEDREVHSLVESAEYRMANFSDRESLSEVFKEGDPSMDQSKLQQLLDKLKDSVRNPEAGGLRIRYVIAEVIGKDYGERERLKYILAVITGLAA